MDYLIPLLIVLVVLVAMMTLIGHGIWLGLAWCFRQLSGPPSFNPVTPSPSVEAPTLCLNCRSPFDVQMKYCGRCGAVRLTVAQEEQLRELEGTLRQLDRLHQAGALDEVNFRVLKIKIDNEREQIRSRQQLLLTQYVSGPLAEWLAQWPATGGSTLERLQLALRRVPAAVRQLDIAVSQAITTGAPR